MIGSQFIHIFSTSFCDFSFTEQEHLTGGKKNSDLKIGLSNHKLGK